MAKTFKLSSPEIFLLISLSVFGFLTLWWLPLSAGYDEETHFVRVWQMSTFDFLPNKVDEAQTPFPSIYWNLSYRRQVIVKAVEPDFWGKYGNLSIDAWDYNYGVKTRSVYSPVLLFPQAIVTRYTGRAFNLPALPVFYLTRLAGLLSYLLLTWFALRIIPYGKWLFALLALSPMALLQAVTISADTISNGIAFLFIAGILAIEQKEKIGWKEWWGIILLSILLFSAKINLVFLILLPLLLISPKRFKMKKGYLLLLGAIFTLFLIEGVGWSVIAYPRLGTTPKGTNPVEQIRFIFSHPLFFIKTVATDIFTHISIRFKHWIALYGYDYWPVPKITYLFYGIALLTTLFSKRDEKTKPNQRQRIIFFSLFLLGYIATVVLMYLSFTPVENSSVIGVQGRYFTVVMPLLFLSLVGMWKPNQKIALWLKRGVIIFGILSLGSYITGLWLSYHVPCGSQYYQQGLCYQPNYKNFSPESNYSEPLSNNLKLTQEIVPECDGMTTVRIWVNTAESSLQNQTEFSFTDQDGSSLIREILKNEELPSSGWYSLSFQPEWESSQKIYILTLKAMNNLQKNGIKIAYSIRPEYPQGLLYENEEVSEQDIIFQYGCIAGRQKLKPIYLH